jgi:hypothetical protein
MEETWGLSSLTCHDLHTIAVPEIMGKLSKSNRWLALALPPPQYPPNLLRSHHHSPGPEDHPRDASQEITAISRHEQADPRAALEKGEEAGAGTLYARGKSAPSRRLGSNLESNKSPMSHHVLGLHVPRLPHFRCDLDTRCMR